MRRSEHGLLPDALTLPLVVIGLVIAAIFDPETLAERAAAAALGYLALRTLAFAYYRVRHRDGLCQGDDKRFAAAGAWRGTAALPEVILVAAGAGLAMAAGFVLAGAR